MSTQKKTIKNLPSIRAISGSDWFSAEKKKQENKQQLEKQKEDRKIIRENKAKKYNLRRNKK